MKSPLEELVKRLLYTGEARECTLVVVHRGARGDVKEVEGTELIRVEDRFLVLADDTFIPLHRIRKIMRGEIVLWEKTR